MANSEKPKHGIRIRSYNVGLGDCFLLSFLDDGVKRNMLIDFGTAPGQSTLAYSTIAKNIYEETEGHLDVVVLSNEHHDHVGGFLAQKEVFDKIGVDHVWMGLPSNPGFFNSNSKAKTFKRVREQVKEFRASISETSIARKFETLLENNKPVTKQVDYVRGLPGKKSRVQYLARGSDVKSPFGSRIQIEVLGPENDISVYYPNSDLDEYFEIQDLDSISKRLDSKLKDQFKKKHPLLTSQRFKNVSCIEAPENLSDRDWRLLKKKNQSFGVQEMRAIDCAVNNTSLVLLLTINGKRLLFPGDAEATSWEWVEYAMKYCSHCVEYEEISKCADCKRRRKAMKSLQFLKLAQHGSKTGTPDEIRARLASDATVMVSTKKNVYGVKNPIPDSELLEELKTHHGKKLVVTNDDKMWVDATL